MDNGTQQEKELSPDDQKKLAAQMEFLSLVKFACFEAIKDYFEQARRAAAAEAQAQANAEIQRTIIDTSFHK